MNKEYMNGVDARYGSYRRMTGYVMICLFGALTLVFLVMTVVLAVRGDEAGMLIAPGLATLLMAGFVCLFAVLGYTWRVYPDRLERLSMTMPRLIHKSYPLEKFDCKCLAKVEHGRSYSRRVYLHVFLFKDGKLRVNMPGYFFTNVEELYQAINLPEYHFDHVIDVIEMDSLWLKLKKIKWQND